METLASLAKILRRSEPTTAIRALREDVSNALANERATDAEILEMVQRAQTLKVLKGGSAIV